MAKKQENFEESLARLSAIVEELEAGEVPLEKGVALFKEGVALAALCRKRLEQARNEVAVVRGGLVQDLPPVGEDGDD
jgi:exodeoxyribonuclease VII small subunit